MIIVPILLPQDTFTTPVVYSSLVSNAVISLTIGGHINACARPLILQIPAIAQGEVQKVINIFMRTVVPSPIRSNFFGENLSPRIPLKICPAPYVIKLPVSAMLNSCFENPVEASIAEITAL